MSICKYCKKGFTNNQNNSKKYCSKKCSDKFWMDYRGCGIDKKNTIFSTTIFDWRDYPNGVI